MLTDLLSYLGSVIVASIWSSDGQSSMLVSGLILLLHMAGLVSHAVAVLQTSTNGGQTEARVLA